MKNHLLLVFFVLVVALNANANNINKPVSSQYGFIENKGQIIDQNNNPNPSVLYLYNGNGLRVQLRKEGFSYEVINTIKTPKTIIDKAPHGKFASQADSFDITYQTHRVDINFKDGNKNATLKPYQPASDFINYYTTGTSEAGVTNVHHYQKIVYENVYPNIDIEFVLNDATNKGKFKYNFIVKPNGNLADIKLAFLGANRTSLNQAGNILIETAYGNIEENIPLSYVINNNNSHSTIKANFIALDNNTYGIKAENYNHDQTLVIDPNPLATYYGGSDTDIAFGITTDTSGNILITGYTVSGNAISTTGSYQSTYGGVTDAFIAKFNTNGVRQWATYYGGSSYDQGNGITRDASGNIFITGNTFSSNAIATLGSHQANKNVGNDAFIAKFNTNGGMLWATYYGGDGNEQGNGITTDISGNILIIGYTTTSGNVLSTTGSYQAINGGSIDAFIAKFNTNGVRQWATYYGGNDNDQGNGITVDASENIIITGFTASTNAIATIGSHQLTNGGSNDAFIAKFSANGVRQWATYYGGSGNDQGNGITRDASGNIIITGQTNSTTTIVTFGSHQTTNNGGIDVFIAKFNNNGVRQWATYYGGSVDDYGQGITTDTNGNILITGYASSGNAISTIGSYQTINGGFTDAFIAKFNSNGVRQWATFYGGNDYDYGQGIITDKGGDILITGYTGSTNAIVITGSHQTTNGGSTDAFISKFTTNGILSYVEKNKISGTQTIFAGAVPNVISDSIRISNISLNKWIRSDVDSINGYYSIVGTSATYSSPALTNTAWFKRIITDGNSISDTSNAIQITVNKSSTWVGATSNAWGVASNWSTNVVPVSASNVFINSGVPFMPLISDGGRVCNNITIANGGALTINNTNSNLTIYGNFINNGLFSNTNGRVNFSGTSTQVIPPANYARLGINNIAGVSCSGNIIIKDSLVFNNGCFSIGNNNLTLLGTTSKIIGANATKFIITNGTGLLKFQNIGTGTRTTTTLFPIGTSASSYTPLSFLNTGTSDTISVRVINGISGGYSGTTTTGLPISAFAVNRTWFVTEGIAGGSVGTVTLQWNADEELPAMDNTLCYISFHNGTSWNPTTTATATGLSPYTRSRSGLSLFNNTAFAIGSDGTLPVKLLSFNATLVNEKVNCAWETASETNNDYFTIERSKDGNSFEAVGNVKGQGNSNRNIRYSYTDNNPFGGISYYRLKQTDFDGKYTYSEIKKVGLDKELASKISLYYENENPIVKINSFVESKANIELINLNGIKLFTNEQPIIKGENTFTLDGNRTKGLYLLKVQVEEEVKYFKVWLR
jgi:hypothetical protein